MFDWRFIHCENSRTITLYTHIVSAAAKCPKCLGTYDTDA